MLRSSVLVVMLTLLPLASAWGKGEEIEWDWVREDSIVIATLVDVITNRPHDILTLDVLRRRMSFETLGSGYSYRETMTQGGYATTRLQIVLKDGKPVAFAATPRLPFPYDTLYDRYRKFYGAKFTFDSAGEPRTYYWNWGLVSTPLGDSAYIRRYQRLTAKNPHRKQIELMMSPYSGIEYGCGTEEANTIPSNRRIYKLVAPTLDYLLATCMLRSINPATRMTAIEYIQRYHPDRLTRKSLKKQIDRMLKEHPKVMTLHDGMRATDDARKLIKLYAAEGCGEDVPMPEPKSETEKAAEAAPGEPLDQ